MKNKLIIALVVVALSAGGWYAYRRFASLKSPKQKMSYALGVQVGSSLRNQGVELDAEALSQAIRDLLGQEKPKLSEEELTAALRSYQEEAQKLVAKVAEKNHAEGASFLQTNALRKEVTSLPNGLQYETLKEGKGKKIGPSDIVVVNYKGTLISGAEFESSARQGQPVPLQVSQLIPGLQTGLTLMREGSIFRFFISPELAYRDQGRPGIPPMSTLIFEIEAIQVQAPAKKKEKK